MHSDRSSDHVAHEGGDWRCVCDKDRLGVPSGSARNRIRNSGERGREKREIERENRGESAK